MRLAALVAQAAGIFFLAQAIWPRHRLEHRSHMDYFGDVAATKKNGTSPEERLKGLAERLADTEDTVDRDLRQLVALSDIVETKYSNLRHGMVTAGLGLLVGIVWRVWPCWT